MVQTRPPRKAGGVCVLRQQFWTAHVQSTVKDWKIYTFLDIGGKSQLRYEHKVGICEHVYLREHIDLQGWMGLGHTKWDQITNTEIAEAAHGLREICAHFMAVLPNLLDGLIPPMAMKDVSGSDSGSAVPPSLLF